MRITRSKAHMWIVKHCFKIMNGSLRKNILKIDGPASFLDNSAGVVEKEAPKSKPIFAPHIQYACTYWFAHLKDADKGDSDLMKEAKIFTEHHLLHWFEALSWMNRLDFANGALENLLTFSKSAFPESSELLSDGLRFITTFHDIIQRSALHIYHSALPFTPRETRLYERYMAEMKDNICQVQGAPAKWDLSMPVEQSTLSHDGSRLAVLRRNTVSLWDNEKMEKIADLDCQQMIKSHSRQLSFSPGAHRLALTEVNVNGDIRLWDGIRGTFTVDLHSSSYQHSHLVFSVDGWKVAALATRGYEASKTSTLMFWDSRDGRCIGSAENVRWPLAVSPDGSFIATAAIGPQVILRSGGDAKPLSIIDKLDIQPKSLTFVKDNLVIFAEQEMAIYKLKDRELVKLPINDTTLSRDNPRLVISSSHTHLPDFSEDKKYNTAPKERTGLSPSMPVPKTRENSGYRPNTRLRAPDNILRTASDSATIAGYGAFRSLASRTDVRKNMHHSKKITFLAFSADSRWLATYAEGKTIKLWDCRDGTEKRIRLYTETFSSLAVSKDSFLAAASTNGIALWNAGGGRTTTLKEGRAPLTFSPDGSLLVSCTSRGVAVWRSIRPTQSPPIAIEVEGEFRPWKLTVSPDNTRLAAQFRNGDLKLFDLIYDRVIEDTKDEDLSWIPQARWGEIQISLARDSKNGYRVMGRFPDRLDDVPILRIPQHRQDIRVSATAIGSSVIALGCNDGRIILIRGSP